MKKTEQAIEERNQRKSAQGIVISDKMTKTVIVQVERLVKHPRYKKYVRRYGKFYAHDEKQEAKNGDLVEIMSTRPLSRLKRWRVVRVVTKAKTQQKFTASPEQVLADLAGAQPAGEKR